MCNKRHLPTVWRKGDSPTSSTKLFAVWGSPCSFVHEDTKMDSNVLCLLALKVKWLSIVLQSRFYSFLSYKQIIKNHQPWPPWFDVSKRIVLVGWLVGKVAEFLAQWVNCAWGAKSWWLEKPRKLMQPPTSWGREGPEPGSHHGMCQGVVDGCGLGLFFLVDFCR